MYTKLGFLRCFNMCFFTNQVTNVVKKVVPFCKSGHKYKILFDMLFLVLIGFYIHVIHVMSGKAVPTPTYVSGG